MQRKSSSPKQLIHVFKYKNEQCDISVINFPLPGNLAAGRFLILSKFYCFLILRSEQVAGTNSVARRQVADSKRAYGFVYMGMRVQRVCTCVCTCIS